jgi:hypothetical protein
MGTSNRNGEMPRQGSSDEAGSLFLSSSSNKSPGPPTAVLELEWGVKTRLPRPDSELDLDLDPGLAQEGGHVTATTKLILMPILPQVSTSASACLV